MMSDGNKINILGFQYLVDNKYDRLKINDNWNFGAYRVDYTHDGAEHEHGWVAYFYDVCGEFPQTEENASFYGHSYVSAQDAATNALGCIKKCRNLLTEILDKIEE